MIQFLGCARCLHPEEADVTERLLTNSIDNVYASERQKCENLNSFENKKVHNFETKYENHFSRKPQFSLQKLIQFIASLATKLNLILTNFDILILV